MFWRECEAETKKIILWDFFSQQHTFLIYFARKRFSHLWRDFKIQKVFLPHHKILKLNLNSFKQLSLRNLIKARSKKSLPIFLLFPDFWVKSRDVAETSDGYTTNEIRKWNEKIFSINFVSPFFHVDTAERLYTQFK